MILGSISLRSNSKGSTNEKVAMFGLLCECLFNLFIVQWERHQRAESILTQMLALSKRLLMVILRHWGHLDLYETVCRGTRLSTSKTLKTSLALRFPGLWLSLNKEIVETILT